MLRRDFHWLPSALALLTLTVLLQTTGRIILGQSSALLLAVQTLLTSLPLAISAYMGGLGTTFVPLAALVALTCIDATQQLSLLFAFVAAPFGFVLGWSLRVVHAWLMRLLLLSATLTAGVLLLPPGIWQGVPTGVVSASSWSVVVALTALMVAQLALRRTSIRLPVARRGDVLWLACVFGALAWSSHFLVIDWAAENINVSSIVYVPVIPGQSPPTEEYHLEAGYRLDLISSEFNKPTALTIGDRGEIYVSDAGATPDGTVSGARIVQVLAEGHTQEIARIPIISVNAMAFYHGRIYAVGGHNPGRVWRVNPANGEVEIVLSGFPVWSPEAMSSLTVGPDGRLYFAVGSPTNAGVVGLNDYWESGWLPLYPEGRDIPCIDTKLTGRNYTTTNPFGDTRAAKAVTGAFKPFGQPSQPGETIKGTPAPACNGALFRAKPDGSDLEVYATGFRRVSGLTFSPEGRLIGLEPEYENVGSRPIAASFAAVWQIELGRWYGYPDYPSGIPVTNPRFKLKNQPAPHKVLTQHPQLAPGPFFQLTPHAGSNQLAFSTSNAFGHKGEVFVTQSGNHVDGEARGFRIIRIDMTDSRPMDFYVNLRPGMAGVAPESPIGISFTRDGSTLYFIDVGLPSGKQGALWRITRIE